MNDWLWHVIAAPAIAEPIQGQDFDFENWEVADRGWMSSLTSYSTHHPGGSSRYPLSDVGVSWEQARDGVWNFTNEEIHALLEQATPGQPWEYTIDDGVVRGTWAIEKVQD